MSNRSNIARPRKPFRLSETDRGQQLHSGEIVLVEFWLLMLTCLNEELPHLVRGDVYTAKELIPAIWARLRHNERFRMGRCLHSYSREPSARIHRVSEVGRSPYRYRLI